MRAALALVLCCLLLVTGCAAGGSGGGVDRLRIMVHLIDGASGSYLWSESLDGSTPMARLSW